MSRPSPRRPLLFVIAALLLAAGAFGVYHLTLGRPPLAGDASHDFGIVDLDAEGRAEIEHTFRLVNRTRSTITLGAARSSCGCTTPHISAAAIEPGEPLDVTARVVLSKTGLTTATISLPMIGRGVRTFHLRAIGKPQRHLRSPRGRIMLTPGETETIVFFADLWDNQDAAALPPPAIAARPEALRTGPLEAWSKHRDARSSRGEPETWMGRFTIACDENALPEDAAVVLTFGEQSLTIPVEITQRRLRPPSGWREGGGDDDRTRDRDGHDPLQSPFPPKRPDETPQATEEAPKETEPRP